MRDGNFLIGLKLFGMCVAGALLQTVYQKMRMRKIRIRQEEEKRKQQETIRMQAQTNRKQLISLRTLIERARTDAELLQFLKTRHGYIEAPSLSDYLLYAYSPCVWIASLEDAVEGMEKLNESGDPDSINSVYQRIGNGSVVHSIANHVDALGSASKIWAKKTDPWKIHDVQSMLEKSRGFP